MDEEPDGGSGMTPNALITAVLMVTSRVVVLRELGVWNGEQDMVLVCRVFRDFFAGWYTVSS
ncbi:hypothetical protein ACP70R_048826 [Stipagrostis hirtigluma subsp. patula]